MEPRTVDSVFDVDKYLETNPDVRTAIERGNVETAEEHYYKYGAVEGRQAFWKIIGKNRSYQCEAILIDGAVDVMGQYSILRDQRLLDVHFHVIGDDPDKFEFPQNGTKVSLIGLEGRPPHHVVHGLIPRLKSDFIVFSVPCLITDPDYVRSQINRIQNSGREVLIRIGFHHGNLVIVRKNTFLDMGGFRDISSCYLEDLIERARAEERPFDYGEILRSAHDNRPSENTESLRHHAIGYEQRNVEADIVLPFYGQLEFVEEAIKSVVDQDNADVIVHLIDDCSNEDTSDFLKRWKSHRNVRVYRNSTNIGQFMTMNNIVPFLETDYIATMDGDDVSASNRIHEGVNLLELTRSDVFGSRIRIFGDEYAWEPVSLLRKKRVKKTDRHWNAVFPHEMGGHYFPNSSVIVTKKSFVDIGGFTDFGYASKNKIANDSELLLRYFYAGYGTCYSVSRLVDYRRHSNSVTQNEDTGWSTPAMVYGSKEVERRRKFFFESRNFVPSSFGSLEDPKWAQYTRVWEG